MKESNSLPFLFHKKDTHHLKMHCEIVSLLIIPSSDTCNHHVSYKIKMTTGYNTWFISKRYTHYESSKNIDNKDKMFSLLSPRRFFQFSESTIKERRTHF